MNNETKAAISNLDDAKAKLLIAIAETLNDPLNPIVLCAMAVVGVTGFALGVIFGDFFGVMK